MIKAFSRSRVLCVSSLAMSLSFMYLPVEDAGEEDGNLVREDDLGYGVPPFNRLRTLRLALSYYCFFRAVCKLTCLSTASLLDYWLLLL